MTTRHGARIRALRWSHALSAYLVLSVALVALTAIGNAPVLAATHRTAKVSPATNLGDEVVQVSWTGFRPTQPNGNYGVRIMQCTAHPHSVLRDCNTQETFPFSLIGNQQDGVTHTDGTGSTFMDIMTTARLPSLVCSETHACSLLLYEETFNGFDPRTLPKNRVIVPISFRRSFGDCPPVQRFDVRIETEASAAPALYQWAANFCTGAHAFTIDVTKTSSNQAREDYLNREVDIGVTSIPPKADETTAKTARFSVTPIDLTAVVFAYNITDPVTHKRITDLTLTPRLAARLLSDSEIQTFFKDPEFRALNPHHSWPLEAADPGLRGEKNADTWIVTKWLNGSSAARAFLNGKDHYHVAVNPSWRGVSYPTDVFAARNANGVYFPRAGEEGVAQRLFASTKPADSVPTDPLNAGFIGVLDLPTALRFQLPIANLTNGVGKPVVSLTSESLAAGYAAMQSGKRGFHTMTPTVTAPDAYPLTKVDSALVPTALTHSNRDLRIRALLDYAVGPGQENLPAGYAALPAELQHQTLSYTGDLPPPTTTTTTAAPTTTPPAPSTGTFDPSFGGGTNYSPPVYTPETPVTTASPYSTNTTTTTTTAPAAGPRRARFVALRVPDNGDRWVLPIMLSVALLALLASGVDVVHRRGRKLVRK